MPVDNGGPQGTIQLIACDLCNTGAEKDRSCNGLPCRLTVAIGCIISCNSGQHEAIYLGNGIVHEAQRKSVEDFLNGGNWSLVEEFVEVESGGKDDRPKLAAAMAMARAHGARLVIAKLDRLSRDAAFLLGLQKARVKFVAADMPEANEMVVGIMAVVAEAERKMIRPGPKTRWLPGRREASSLAASEAGPERSKSAQPPAAQRPQRPIPARLTWRR